SELVTMDAGIVNSKPTPVSEEDLPNLVPIFQAMYVGDPSAIDAFQAQHEAALEADFNTVRSQNILFEILPKGASKASALQALSQTLGYSRDQVMALGDANNDLEMLRFAGYSVAMGNGNAAVKEIADFITLTNDEDGVAHAIHKLIETEKGE
ncbi:HAD-IIB family hydrolase, partial [Streptococcus parasanguinis]